MQDRLGLSKGYAGDPSGGPFFHQLPSAVRETAVPWQTVADASGLHHQDFAHITNHNAFKNSASPSNFGQTTTKFALNPGALDLDLQHWIPNPSFVEPWASQSVGCHHQLTMSQGTSTYLESPCTPTIHSQVNSHTPVVPTSNNTHLNEAPEYFGVAAQKVYPPPSSWSSLDPVPQYSSYIARRDFEGIEDSGHLMGLPSNDMMIGGVYAPAASVSEMIQWATTSHMLPQTPSNNFSPFSQYEQTFTLNDLDLANFDRSMA